MATNDFVTFAADPAADVETQANYIDVAATWRILGFATGTAISTQLNKVWRQASLISAMIGEFCITETGNDMLDDGTTTGMAALQNTFTAAVQAAAIAAIGTGYLPLTGGTLTGNLVVNSPLIQINSPTGTNANFALNSHAANGDFLTGYTNNVARWQMALGDVTPETGQNAGSNFSLSRFADSGAVLGTPISINRATGIVNFAQVPTLNNQPLPFLPSIGGYLSGDIIFTGGTGIYYAVGTYSHAHEFGWDGANILAWVDGTYEGNLALQGWVSGVVGGYLPLSGGTLTGNLQVNGSLVVNGGSGFRSSVWFANIGDFANFSDGRTRYRQWAGNWWDGWDGTNGNRTWYCAGGQSMFLDGAANFQTSGHILSLNGRIISQSGGASSVSAWNYGAGSNNGFWNDGNLVFGGLDGSGNPSSAWVWVQPGGQLNVAGGASVGGQIYSGNNIVAAAGLIAYGGASISANCVVGQNISAGGAIWCNGSVVSYGSKVMAQGGWPQIAVYNTSTGNAASWDCGSGGLEWGAADGNGNRYNGLMNLDWGGNFFVAGHIYTPSDERLKDNITPADDFDSLAAICRTPIHAYDRRLDGQHVPHGIIAQEIRQTLPDVVMEHGADATLALDTHTMLVHAFRAIAQLNAKLEALHV
jgi:hypothetical protein